MYGLGTESAYDIHAVVDTTISTSGSTFRLPSLPVRTACATAGAGAR